MSGGMKSSFSSDLSAEEMGALEKEFNAKSNELQELRTRKFQLDNEIENLTNQISRLEVDIPKMEMVDSLSSASIY